MFRLRTGLVLVIACKLCQLMSAGTLLTTAAQYVVGDTKSTQSAGRQDAGLGRPPRTCDQAGGPRHEACSPTSPHPSQVTSLAPVSGTQQGARRRRPIPRNAPGGGPHHTGRRTCAARGGPTASWRAAPRPRPPAPRPRRAGRPRPASPPARPAGGHPSRGAATRSGMRCGRWAVGGGAAGVRRARGGEGAGEGRRSSRGAY